MATNSNGTQAWQDGDLVTHLDRGTAIVRWSPDRTALTLIYTIGNQITTANQATLTQQGWRRESE